MAWVYLIHPDTGGEGKFPDEPGVIPWYEARGWVRAVMPAHLDPDAPNADTTAQAQEAYDPGGFADIERILTADEVAALKGAALDEALDKAELSKAGTADEKRSRLAEYEAGLADTTPEGEVNG